MKNISRVLTAFGLSFVFTLALSQPVWAENNNADLPTEKTLKSELAEAQKLPDGDEKTNNVATIQASLDFLQQIQTQQKNNNDLQDTLIDADSEIQKNNADLQNLKKQLSTPNNTDYASQSLANLQAQVEKLTNQQQDAQSALSAVNTQLAGQSSVSERAQTALTDNVKRTQELNQKLADPTTSSLLKQQIQLELQLIELKN
ncbi:MAG: mechanosensitive channel MscK, partial [Haemophilus parainfluenzae]